MPQNFKPKIVRKYIAEEYIYVTKMLFIDCANNIETQQ